MSDDERPLAHSRAWAVIRASALHRLGKPLLLAYLWLLAFGVVVVLGSLLWMWFG
jgi:hypothetical protein